MDGEAGSRRPRRQQKRGQPKLWAPCLLFFCSSPAVAPQRFALSPSARRRRLAEVRSTAWTGGKRREGKRSEGGAGGRGPALLPGPPGPRGSLAPLSLLLSRSLLWLRARSVRCRSPGVPHPPHPSPREEESPRFLPPKATTGSGVARKLNPAGAAGCVRAPAAVWSGRRPR